MKNKLPEDVRDNAEQLLWDKSNGRCFLCEEPLNRSADDIEADHDEPESVGGPTTIENLNLSHESCNRAKRNAKSVPIRPYLKLAAFARKNGGRLKYDGFLQHFGIQPKPIVVTVDGDYAFFELPDQTTVAAPVLREANASGMFEYVFLSLPKAAIFNDDACQPRALRVEHAWSIYSDLQRNPLHEPPSCRLDKLENGAPVRLLLFDGQHKTVANWMLGREHVTAKVYLDLTTAQTIELVNSIQAKIKKLPLSPFELAGKMSDEWENKFSEYEEAVGSAEVSEDGFLRWVVPTEKPRAKQALQSALVQTVLTASDLRLAAHVKRPGAPAPKVSVTEQTLKGKVIEKLLCMEPLKTKGEDAQAERDAETTNIVLLLNMLNDEAFEPLPDVKELNETELERARRMTYQSSLAHIAALMRLLWNHVMLTTGSKDPMSAKPGETQMSVLREGVRRLVQHPVWTAEFDRDEKMAHLKVALEKNQEVPKALEKLGLDLAYLILGNQSSTFKEHWLRSVD